jgi:hypothetical protein
MPSLPSPQDPRGISVLLSWKDQRSFSFEVDVVRHLRLAAIAQIYSILVAIVVCSLIPAGRP